MSRKIPIVLIPVETGGSYRRMETVLLHVAHYPYVGNVRRVSHNSREFDRASSSLTRLYDGVLTHFSRTKHERVLHIYFFRLAACLIRASGGIRERRSSFMTPIKFFWLFKLETSAQLRHSHSLAGATHLPCVTINEDEPPTSERDRALRLLKRRMRAQNAVCL